MGRVFKNKLREWFRRYIFAEVIGTFLGLLLAMSVYESSGSYMAAAAAGFVAEGAGFYGFFIIKELHEHRVRTKGLSFARRMVKIVAGSTTNLFVEFAPAAAVCSFIIMPLALYMVPQYVRPYGLGFIIGKVSVDIIFYNMAIAGYETRKWLRRRRRERREVPRLEAAMEFAASGARVDDN